MRRPIDAGDRKALLNFGAETMLQVWACQPVPPVVVVEAPRSVADSRPPSRTRDEHEGGAAGGCDGLKALPATSRIASDELEYAPGPAFAIEGGLLGDHDIAG